MSTIASLIDQIIYTVPTFTLECGRILHHVPVAYKTWGKLNDARDNVMIICHAFTGSADVEDWYVTHMQLVINIYHIYNMYNNAGGAH
jgi:homoserine O-acetyltransferase/O-succinyltransferase